MGSLRTIIGLLIYKYAPIKKNRFVFTSFSGHYSDNTKAISIKLHEVDSQAEIIWLVKKEYMPLVPEYANAIDIDSFSAYWYRGTASMLIDNVYGYRAIFKCSDGFLANVKFKINCFFRSKKRQPIITTMHGTAIKKIGRDQIGNVVLDMFCPNTVLLLGDEHTAEILKRVTFEKIPIKVTGAPRNDVLFRNDNLKKQIGLKDDKKIILFAPTFRNDGKDTEGKNVYRSGLDQLNEMDFELLFKTLSEKFGGDWVMVCRFHYHVEKMVDWADLESKYPGKFVNGNLYDDMADYLSCADILVSDSSSCMCDFALTKKPCFIFFPDMDNYGNKERGFYIDLYDTPFAVSKDFASFIDNINSFDQKNYDEAVDLFLKKIGSGDDGNAACRVVEYINNERKAQK